MRELTLVTGATGFVGRHLVRSLLADKNPVVLMTRNPNNTILKEFASARNQVTIYVADIQKKFVIPENVTTIYNCAGIISDYSQMEGVNIEGTRNVVEASLKQGCRLIHLSSAGVTGATKENLITENTVCKPCTKYEWTKLRAERIIYDGIDRGLKAQILRPTIIIGTGRSPNRDSFLQLLQSMKSGLYRNIGEGLYNIVHIDEVVRVMHLLNGGEFPNGETFIINTPISYKELARIVSLATTGIARDAKSLPYSLAWFAGALLSSASVISRKSMPFTLSRFKALTNSKSFVQTKLENTLNYQPLYPIQKYIEITCTKYQELGLL